MMTTQARRMEHSMTSSTDYRVRRGEISAYGRALASAQRLRTLVVFVGCVAVSLLLVLLLVPWPISRSALLIFVGAFIVLVGVALYAIYLYTNRHFIEPDLAFRMWLQQVCDGDLDARIGLDTQHRHYKELNFHTQNLASSLRRLSDDMDSLVESQTDKLNEQNRVLELLFKLTADVSSEAQDGSAFVTVCQYMMDWFEAANVSCYKVIKDEHTLHCVALCSSDGTSNECSNTNIIQQSDIAEVSLEQIPQQISNIESTVAGSSSSIWVPFFAASQIAGVLIIERNSAAQNEHSQTSRVLTTVSEQLSLLCSQQLVQEQVLQTRLGRERNELAAEIHDSLAQTLLALRYQTTLLSEKLKNRDEHDVYQDVLPESVS